MIKVVITLPAFFPGEAEKIAYMLRSGTADLLHLRKPGSNAAEMEQLIRQIPTEFHQRLVLHDHHHLAAQYGLHGIHLNSRNPEPPKGKCSTSLSLSRSCHSLEEVKLWKERCNYVSISPIYDSISKQGYKSAFTKEQLLQAHRNGIIDGKVFALGGITFGRLHEVEALGFGGAMILGDAWKRESSTPPLP